MVKIAILTFSFAHNYGAVLQTYALYSYLKENGYDPFVIDYLPKEYNLNDSNYAKLYCDNNAKWGSSLFRRLLARVYVIPNMKRNAKIFNDFVKGNINLSEKYYSKEQMIKDPPIADVYITGSDQVWNPDFVWNDTIDTVFFFDFLDSSKKIISYASSFGKSKLNDNENNIIKNLLKKYKRISVREKTGKNILNKLGYEAEVVADPTIMVDKKIWDTISSERIVSDKYLLCFMIGLNKNTYSVVNNLAKQKGVKCIFISPNIGDKIKFGNRVICLPKVSEWISYFKYADMIVTNSFHGTVFATVYNKKFASIISNSKTRYSSRISDYLKLLEIENHILDYDRINTELESILFQSIDYENANKIRSDYAVRSRNWLDSTIAFCYENEK